MIGEPETAARTEGGALLLDGKRTAHEIREAIAAHLKALHNPLVTLATVLVGEDPPSQLYVRTKHREAQAAGMHSRHVALPSTVSQAALESQIKQLGADPDVHGILVQLPLPGGLNAQAVIDLLPPEKDVDGLTERNLGRLVRAQKGLVPCTPRGVMRLIERYRIPTQGSKAVVVGRSTLVGLPLVLLLGARGVDCTVTLAHSRTADLAAVTRAADILIAAVGVAGLITAAHVKPGAAVFDVGVTHSAAGIHGDVDFAAVQAIAGAITPMPGGTGPMTVACLLENTVEAARMQGVLPA
ncbi:MAG: bifunctional 5,10-methylenetetrahydrofolate dehydrogenase/5,10-methenyltetrahydrofolate cyclohydrolase [Burkholderiales bacterium]